ncbi:MAG: WD40 repeat domain-containing protein [Armatimonas sp.]
MIPLSTSHWYLLLVGAVCVLLWLFYLDLRKTFRGTQVMAFLFSEDNQTLYGGGIHSISPRHLHGWVWAWDVATGRLLWRSKTTTPIAYLTLSPDGNSLVAAHVQGVISGGIWGGATLWDVATRKERFPLTDAPNNALTHNVYFTPDSQRILGCYREGIQVWDGQTGERLAFWNLPEDKIGWPTRLHFSADGTKMLVQANDEPEGAAFVQLWNAETGAPLQDFPVTTTTICALSPEAERVALEAHPGKNIARLELYTAEGQQISQSPEIPDYYPTALSFTPDGNVLCKGYYSSLGQSVRIQDFLWDIHINQLIEQPARSKGFLSSDGQWKAIVNTGDHKNRPPLGTIYRVDTDEKLCDLEGLAGR